MAEKEMKKSADYDKVTNGVLHASLRIVLLLGVAVLLYFCVVRSYTFGYQIFENKPFHPDSSRSISVTIPEDCGRLELAEALENANIIENAYVFAVQSRMYGTEIVPGKHVISDAMTPREILKVLSQAAETE